MKTNSTCTKMSWKMLSSRIDKVIGFVGDDVNHVLHNVIGSKLKVLSVKQQNFLGTTLPIATRVVTSALSQAVESDKTLKGYALKGLISLIESNVNDAYGKMRDYEETSSKAVELSCYGDITAKAKTVMQESCPVNSLTILLHGPGGVGKSYCATHLSAVLYEGVTRLQFTNPDGTVKDLPSMIKYIDGCFNRVFLIDEVDKLLVLDGIVPVLHAILDDIKSKTDKSIVVMTTNHYDVLKDLPLCRPGRVDIIKEIKEVTEKDAIAVCSKWMQEWEEISKRVEPPLTVAKIAQACRDAVMEQLTGGTYAIRE